METKIIILRGNAGSGKSTISRALCEHFNDDVLYLEQDTFRLGIIKTKQDENFQVRRNVLTQGAMLAMLNWGLENCKYIIFDGIFSVKKYTNLIDEILKKSKNVYAYYFDLPFEETAKRHSTRDKAKLFDAEVMREWFKPHDYLPQIKEKIITKELTKEQIVSMILSDVE